MAHWRVDVTLDEGGLRHIDRVAREGVSSRWGWAIGEVLTGRRRRQARNFASRTSGEAR